MGDIMQRGTALGTTAAIGALLLAGLTASTAASAAPAPQARTAGAAAAAVPSDLRLVRTLDSLLAVHTWYQQTYAGYPVVGGWYAVHAARDGATTTDDGRVPAARLALPTGLRRADLLPSDRAVAAVTQRAGAPDYRLARAERGLSVLPSTATRPARLVYTVLTVTGKGSSYHYVDAATARVLATDKISASARKATGQGKVLDPNPVVKLQKPGLRDKKDAKSAVPPSAYSVVPLNNLNSRTLTGKWAKILNKDRPVSATRTFKYSRANDRFEMVNAYYAVDAAQVYLRSLGFTDVNAESQKILTNAIPDDNSFYEPGADRLLFGRGGVDDAEDVEVIWHEYGHAVQDAQVPGFGRSLRAGSIGEGFGDYLAVTMSQGNSPDTVKTPLACVMDWDATSYTDTTPHCLRRTDGDKVFPDDLAGEVHDDGEIWSRALWDINLALGREHANTAIIEAQFSFTPTIGFPAAAQLTVDTTQALYGDVEAAQVQQAFADRGILAPPT
jgi:Zn-dependent metalloprotease